MAVSIATSLFATEKLDSRFGACAHFMWNKPERERMELCLQRANECSIGFIRTETSWIQAQATKDAPYDFTTWNEVLNCAKRNNIAVSAIITGGIPKWGFHIADKPDEISKFVSAVVKNGGVSSWEITNEPNLQHYWYAQPNPEKYANLLKRLYTEIKRADASATVMYAGVAGVPLDYIEATFKADAHKYFDEMNIHPYQLHDIPEYNLIDEIGELKKLMSAYGIAEKPIVISEMGYSSGRINPSLKYIFAEALKRQGIDVEKTEVCIISDKLYKASTLELNKDVSVFINGAKRQRSIEYCQIKELNPKKNPVLVLPFDESFPYEFLIALKSYINSGGNVIFLGGYPMWFDIVVKDGKAEKVAKRDAGLKCLGLPRPITTKRIRSHPHHTYTDFVEPAFGFENLKLEGKFNARGFVPPSKASGFEFVPIVYGCWKDKTKIKKSPCIAMYKNKNGGSVIFNSTYIDEVVSPELQASYTIRSMLLCYALGIKRISVYTLRDRGTDGTREAHFGIYGFELEQKPLAKAYKTLVDMLGEKSKPTYTEKKGLFSVKWTNPENNKKYVAVWLARGNKKQQKINRDCKIFDLYGNLICNAKKDDFVEISGNPIYLQYE